MEESSYLITTLEAALEYISGGGLSTQKYATVYERGKSKKKRKRPLYAWSDSMNNNTDTPNERLLEMLDLIENEDVDSLKSLLTTWKLSTKFASINVDKSSSSLDITDKESNNGNPYEIIENINDSPICDNDDVKIDTGNITQSLDGEVSSSSDINHECHPLCSCNDERILATSLSSTSQNIKIEFPSISVILHSRDELGRTALHIASLVGNPLTVEILISHNDVSTSGLYRPTNCINCKDAFGRTPIHYASMKGHQNILLLLLHADADHNAIDNEKNTPLHVAANHGQESCVKALIYYAEHQSCSLDLNAQNISQDTPLHLAAKWGYSKIVNILLSYDAR